MVERTYEGQPLDGTYQHITERPVQSPDDQEDDADDVEAGETVYATDPEPDGEQTVENVPMPGDRPDVEGQSTFEDWRWSA
ncbi:MULTISPECIES: hypothetical protein [Salinibaculum]|uniref:hypothetical protein n=1 Tax=Salinibaculum TaxID=2732368 RepID=UPI0030D376CD